MTSKVGQVTFSLIDREQEPVRLELTMPDGRVLNMQPEGMVTRDEARVICGGIMNCMRAGLRADQFRHGEVLQEGSPL